MCYKAAHHPHWGRHHARKWRRNKFRQWGYPPAYVEEFDERYEIQLFAAGYEKSDFQVNLEDSTLIVRVDKPVSDSAEWMTKRGRGFKPGSFERHFKLNDKIDKEGISAQFEDGILKIVLPKREGFETQRLDIDIV